VPQDDWFELMLPVGIGDFQPRHAKRNSELDGICGRKQGKMAGVARSAAVGWHAAVCVGDCGCSALGRQGAVDNQQDQRQLPTANARQGHRYHYRTGRTRRPTQGPILLTRLCRFRPRRCRKTPLWSCREPPRRARDAVEGGVISQIPLASLLFRTVQYVN